MRFHVGYDSDLQFVAETMQRIVEKALGEAMVERMELFRAYCPEPQSMNCKCAAIRLQRKKEGALQNHSARNEGQHRPFAQADHRKRSRTNSVASKPSRGWTFRTMTLL